MNIGQLLRGVIGDVQATDPKALELKVGQVVRGLVLQMLADQEALVNIGGVQVRARLEAPLTPGQSTLLQVQPESTGGQVILKPLASSGVQIAGSSIADVLKALGLKDSQAFRQALQELHQAGVPLTKEALQEYAAVRGGRAPAGAESGQWKQAALLAVQRGLPVTEEAVGALHRALFGRPLDQSLQAFAGQVAEALAQLPEGGSRKLLTQVRQLVQELPAMPQAAVELPAAGAGAQRGGAGGGSEGAAAVRSGGAQAQEPAAGAGAQRGGAGGGSEGAAAARSGGAQEPAAGAGAQRGGAGGGSEGAAAVRSGGAQAQEPGEWIARLLKSLGVEHEQQLARWGAANEPPGAFRVNAEGTGALEQPVTSGMPQHDPDHTKVAETLKGLLLQLSASDDVPMAVKEGAQQLVQQITGQQLLLTPDRTAMFSHVTLMLPLMNGSGCQTAAVHIQSRKGQRGELDSSNCRLLFDLNMQLLGNTLLDVQVTDRIVSLRVHNDQPFVEELLDGHRDEITEGLARIGYQFLSMKCLPYPGPAAPAEGETRTGSFGGNGTPTTARPDFYHSKPYKGVDIRV